ncbi:sensor histidine kinase [Actinomadura sp. KC345]|uniref:ATP-binding protein n=1 Tax=Actinomadura sp. KC345 TaxID=2530371 RepID=UPI001043C90C|nr:ATP-binding protein [Actinomadura sp. KC345]TDC42741.1 sensor histidine kinase [Actinomadura sp. KC345]
MGVEDVVRAAGRDHPVIGEITLPGVRKSVGRARTFVRDTVLGRSREPGRGGIGRYGEGAGDAGPDGMTLDDMVTVASEIVANAITHTASGLEDGEVTVVLSAGGGVYRLEVFDDGAAEGRPYVEEEVGAETGRGMRIVEALAARWGSRTCGHRRVVWAEFPAPAAEGRGRARAPFSDRG